MLKGRRKPLTRILISILLLSSGYIIGVKSNGQNPTIDPDMGIWNFPWYNASEGVNAKEYYRNGLNYTAWVESISGGGVTDHGDLTGLEDDDHPRYLEGSDINKTAIEDLGIDYGPRAYTYFISKRNSNYIGYCGTNGSIAFNDTSASTVAQNCIDEMIVGNKGGILQFDRGDFILTSDIDITGNQLYEPYYSIIIRGMGPYSTTLIGAANEYIFNFSHNLSITIEEMGFTIADTNGKSAIFGDGIGAIYNGSVYWSHFKNLRIRGGNGSPDLHCVHLQNPMRWTWTGTNYISVRGIGKSSGIFIENIDDFIHYSDGLLSGYFSIAVGSNDQYGVYLNGTGPAHGGNLKSVAEIYVATGYTGVKAFVIDHFCKTEWRNWGIEGAQYAWVLRDVEDILIANGGNCDLSSGGAVFNVTQTGGHPIRRVVVKGCMNINIATGEKCTIINDPTVGSQNYGYYSDIYVVSGGKTYWNITDGTRLQNVMIWENGTVRYSEYSGRIWNDGSKIAHNLFLKPQVFYAIAEDAGNIVTMTVNATYLQPTITTHEGAAGSGVIDWYAKISKRP